MWCAFHCSHKAPSLHSGAPCCRCSAQTAKVSLWCKRVQSIWHVGSSEWCTESAGVLCFCTKMWKQGRPVAPVTAQVLTKKLACLRTIGVAVIRTEHSRESPQSMRRAIMCIFSHHSVT